MDKYHMVSRCVPSKMGKKRAKLINKIKKVFRETLKTLDITGADERSRTAGLLITKSVARLIKTRSYM